MAIPKGRPPARPGGWGSAQEGGWKGQVLGKATLPAYCGVNHKLLVCRVTLGGTGFKSEYFKINLN